MMKVRKIKVIEFLILVILAIIIILPLIGIFFSLYVSDLKNFIFSSEVYKAIKGSAITTISTVFFTIPISLICALCVTHTNIKFKTIFSFFCTLPLFLPPISFGFSLLALFGKNGLLHFILGIRFPILGEFGITFGLVLYTFPVAFLMFRNSLLKMDRAIFESAELLGISWIKIFFNITIPQIRKTIISVVLLVSTMSLTEFGICLVIGGKVKTLSLLIYRQIISTLDFSIGVILCCILIIPIFLMLLFEIKIPQVKKTMVYKRFVAVENKKRDFFAYLILSCVSILFFVNILAIVIMSFSENYPVRVFFTWTNLIKVISKPYIYYYINSIVIAFFSSIIGSVLSLAAAYFANKEYHSLIRKFLYFVSVLSYMIPGFIFGIGYMIVYKGSVLYNSYIILIMVNIAHFFASPFLLAYHSFCNMGTEYADIAQLYEISTKHMLINVYLPYMRNTILDMFFYYFANSMITISAVVFLYSSRTMPYSIILKNFEGSTEYLSKSAAVSLVILLTNICVFILTSLLKRKR